ncbi:tyrosine-protein phosphatase non-receptor type 14 [Erinaceus europaeus]|uniref:Tyrosine-protein phosphatase non-receptor type n=1 Tax=Erinaceus europaeus TaxID=9365 RepID=A0ABM3WCX4_ERIEU|nr:tyrosine-protein phosphatase non-receptor type 14 [Erinaceus europaeus]
MPFGLKLRRTRRYNVLSKNCFVTRIRLLDGSVIECTLAVDGTGQECLEAVAQRLELRETHYFGLWFLSKSQQARWAELEKPLKKHLDKFANEPLLFFGVMFYVPSASWLQQEATRYQYYLQVKKDVLEGRLRCTLEQVIRLAGLAVQADFGDYHQFDSQDFLHEYVLFPMDLALEEAVLEELTQKVAQEHKAHRGVLPAEAELMYINEVECLEGFGQESFPVKDNQGNSVHLGIFFMGIFVKNRAGARGQAVMYRWNDVGSVTHNKSTILAELLSKEETLLFHTDDIENAKYISRLFTTRHKFYKQNKICTEQSNSPPPIRRQPTWSRSSLPCQQPYILPPMHVQCGELCLETHASQDSIFAADDAFCCPSRSSLDLAWPGGSVCSVQSLPRASSPGLPGDPRLGALLPSYRPTPDYDTVVRQLARGCPATHGRSPRTLSLPGRGPLAASHPEVRRPCPPPGGPRGAAPRPPGDPRGPRRPAAPGCHTVSTPELAHLLPPPAPAPHGPRPPPPYPRPRPAASTPDLAGPRPRAAGGSSPDLVTRKVQLAVQTFQGDSAPVRLRSLQVQEARAPQRPLPAELPAAAAAARAPPPPARPAAPPARHQRAPSDATVLIHSSDSDEDPQGAPADPHGARLLAALARLPRRPPPDYPGPRKSVSNGALRPDPAGPPPGLPHPRAPRAGPPRPPSAPRPDPPAALGPSISEPNLASGRERVKREQVRERPVSEMFSLEDSIIEREMMIRNLEKQRMTSLEAPKRPLMLAALNGVPVARVSGREDGGARVPMDDRFRALKQRLEEGMVFTEYEQIPKKKANGAFSTAALPENAERGRVREVVPYEDNRVRLVPTKENSTGYINASHIKVVVGGAEWHYIATQGPLPHTCHDFWQMVWEQGANVIAMVTAEEEGGRTKSHRYWPKLGSRHSSGTYGKFKVTTKFRTDSGCYATTGLKVKHLLSGQERTVWHLQYTDWPDHGCPEDIQGFLSYLEEVQSVRRHTNSMLEHGRGWPPPIVVQCSAGVGRTGVLILAELMIYCLEHDEKVEVPAMLRLLREQRMFMVQTVAQYQFVYQVLLQFLQNSRLI